MYDYKDRSYISHMSVFEDITHYNVVIQHNSRYSESTYFRQIYNAQLYGDRIITPFRCAVLLC